MKRALKNAIVCSLMVGFMQGGLVTPLMVAAQGNNAQHNQAQQQETELQKQQRLEKERQAQQRQQEKQRQEQQRQEQQRQEQQAQEQKRQEQQRQTQQAQEKQHQQEQQRQEQQRQQEKQRQDQQAQEKQRQDKVRQDQQAQEKQRQDKVRQDQQAQEKQRQDKVRQDQQRQDQQRQEQQRQEQQRQEQQRQEQQRQEQQRQEQQRQQEKQRQDQQAQEQQRQEQQRQEQQRQEQQRQEQQRQEQQRQEQQRQNKQRQDKERQEQQRQEQQRKAQKKYDWSHDAYRDNNWQRVSGSYNETSNFRWHETSYSMRNRFSSSDYWMEPIYDRDWNDRFPGLHSYRWHDNGSYGDGYFWYGGRRINDCTLFYNNWDEMVGIGFIFDNVFVFIRDDREVYRRHDSSLFNIAFLLLSHEDHNYWQSDKRHDWSHDAYRDDNWSREDYEYRDPSPFRWHESRRSLSQRFSRFELERVYDRDWNDRFPGLYSYRWHDRDDYSDGYYWYRGERIRDAVLFFDDWDELVGIGFTYNDNFVFIRDDQTVYHRNKNNDALLWGIALYLLLR